MSGPYDPAPNDHIVDDQAQPCEVGVHPGGLMDIRQLVQGVCDGETMFGVQCEKNKG